MLLSKDTVSVLKNFNSINAGIHFREGRVITTVAQDKTIQAKYNAPETFPQNCTIYHLDKVLSLLSMFNEPDLTFHDSYLLVKSGKNVAQVRYGDPELIAATKRDEIPLASVDVQVDVTEDHIKTITKLCSVMNFPHIAFVGDGENILLTALDAALPNSDNCRIELGSCDAEFRAVMKVSNLKVIPANYKVSLCKKPGIAKFENDAVTYWMAIEAKSSHFKDG